MYCNYKFLREPCCHYSKTTFQRQSTLVCNTTLSWNMKWSRMIQCKQCIECSGNEVKRAQIYPWRNITILHSLPYLPSSLLSFSSKFLLPIFPYLFLSSIYPWVSFIPSFLAFFLSFLTFFFSFFPSFPFTLVPGESGTAYVKLRDESQVTEFIEVFNGSTVGEDGQDQHTILLSRYDIHKV